VRARVLVLPRARAPFSRDAAAVVAAGTSGIGADRQKLEGTKGPSIASSCGSAAALAAVLVLFIIRENRDSRKPRALDRDVYDRSLVSFERGSSFIDYD